MAPSLVLSCTSHCCCGACLLFWDNHMTLLYILLCCTHTHFPLHTPFITPHTHVVTLLTPVSSYTLHLTLVHTPAPLLLHLYTLPFSTYTCYYLPPHLRVAVPLLRHTHTCARTDGALSWHRRYWHAPAACTCCTAHRTAHANAFFTHAYGIYLGGNKRFARCVLRRVLVVVEHLFVDVRVARMCILDMASFSRWRKDAGKGAHGKACERQTLRLPTAMRRRLGQLTWRSRAGREGKPRTV